MQTYFGFPAQPLERPAILTIGNFDGVHRGHQSLISEMVGAAHAAGCTAGPAVNCNDGVPCTAESNSAWAIFKAMATDRFWPSLAN